jgi:hypothetical protein
VHAEEQASKNGNAWTGEDDRTNGTTGRSYSMSRELPPSEKFLLGCFVLAGVFLIVGLFLQSMGVLK